MAGGRYSSYTIIGNPIAKSAITLILLIGALKD